MHELPAFPGTSVASRAPRVLSRPPILLHPPVPRYQRLTSPGILCRPSLLNQYQAPRRPLPAACPHGFCLTRPTAPFCLILLACLATKRIAYPNCFAVHPTAAAQRGRSTTSRPLARCLLQVVQSSLTEDAYARHPPPRPDLAHYPLRYEDDADRLHPASGSPASLRLSIMRGLITRWSTDSTPTYRQAKRPFDRPSSICQALREYHIETGF